MLKTDLGPRFLLHERPEWRRRGLCFFISLLIHALVFLAIILFISPIEVYIYEDVRNVFIASDTELAFPDFFDGPDVSTPSGSAVPQPGQPAAQVSGLTSQPTGTGGVASSSDPEIDPSISSRFQLSLPADYMLRLPSGFEVDPSLKREQRYQYDYGAGRDSIERDIDLSKYGFSDLSRFDPTRSLRHTPYGGAKAVPGGAVLLQGKAYDLGPWAEKAIDIIMINMILPPSQTTTPSGEVEVSLIINRNGGIISAEVQTPSQSPRLDKAALKALELSSPLPQLPKNFPDQNLKIRLVFSLQ